MSTNSVTRRKFLTVTSGLVVCTPWPHAVSGAGNGNQKRFAIAAAASGTPATDAESWWNIAQGITSDLTETGRFVLVDTELSPDVTDLNRPPDFEKWRGTRTEWLVLGRVTKPDRRFKVECRVWNVANGQQMLGQQYVGSQDDLHRIPHLLAQAMIEELDGERDHSPQ
jgi:TolB protein